MKQNTSNRVYEYTQKRIEIGKAFETFLDLNSPACIHTQKAYHKALWNLQKAYEDIRDEINAEWKKESDKAKKTGDYGRLIHLSIIPPLEDKL